MENRILVVIGGVALVVVYLLMEPKQMKPSEKFGLVINTPNQSRWNEFQTLLGMIQ